jgi:hypothetical protein
MAPRADLKASQPRPTSRAQLSAGRAAGAEAERERAVERGKDLVEEDH